jgi:16S rRNA processing protein RimM
LNKRSSTASDLIRIGSVVKAHGLHGEVIVAPLAGNHRLYYLIEELIHFAGESLSVLKVAKIRPHKGRFILKLESIDDLDEAENLRGHDLYIEKNDLSKDDLSELFLWQSEGSSIITTDGTKIGYLKEVLNAPAHPVLVIVNDRNSEMMLPAVCRFIKEIKVEERVIVVDPPDGIFEIYDF